MSPNQRPKALLEASNHNLSYQTVSKPVHSNHSKNTLDLFLIYKPCRSQRTINRPLISHNRGPQARKRREGREEKEGEKLVPPVSSSSTTARTSAGLPEGRKEGREEPRREGREEARKENEKEEEKLEFSCYQIPPRPPPDFTKFLLDYHRTSTWPPLDSGTPSNCRLTLDFCSSTN
ncbi:hypothetical protein M5K25_005495 [Dendrobium thyrsiflorum]|uniref:Uncharacterized protein n=1 Tax=Dendrobium thyrsiflorum TaxID=117978 RepID=A0ABD0VIX4_DENTH